MFLSETKLPVGCLPTINNYQIFIDTNIKLRHRGGVAVYIHERFSKFVTKLTYDECFISFMLSNSTNYMFIDVYIPPEDSVYADPTAFARLCELLLKCKEKGLTPFIGGDFNSRLGDQNDLPCRWKYLPNCDTTLNNYGKTYFVDMCTACKIHPINNIIYKGNKYKSDFTYIKHNKKSHIDFILTDKDGLHNVTDFNVLTNDWHLSDHRPVTCTLDIPRTTNANNIFLRALELNTDRMDNNKITRLSSKYNYDLVCNYMQEHQLVTEQTITTALHNNDPEAAMSVLDTFINDAHNYPGCKQKSTQQAQKKHKIIRRM